MPQSLRPLANGLTHHVLEWSAPEAKATALLLHGFMDAAATWDLVAPSLVDAGYRVLAPDMRGFGDGPRVGPGGYYHFLDYVFDVADLVEALVPPESPLVVVGHSMGGTIATLYAAAFPSRMQRLVVAEGIGPPDNPHAVAPDRLRRWIDDVRATRARTPRSMASREEALRRLVANHPRVPEDVLKTRLDALSIELADGRFAWKADPLHTTQSPFPFFAESFKACIARVTCPVRFVSGGPLGWHPPDEAERLGAFANLEAVEMPNAGHMMHWTYPAEFAAHIARQPLSG